MGLAMRAHPPAPANPRAGPARAGRGLSALLAIAAAALIIWFAAAPLRAQGPPPFPDFTTVFGRALVDGENLSPPAQPLIAFINGHSCGWSSTQLASAREDVPIGDWGRTVYAVDARADGSGLYQIPGCGTAGVTISLYFPLIGRMATQEVSFGGASDVRADLSLDVNLRYRLKAPLMASDGITR